MELLHGRLIALNVFAGSVSELARLAGHTPTYHLEEGAPFYLLEDWHRFLTFRGLATA
jgi:hypothetical protein